jgi:hypothetical protein
VVFAALLVTGVQLYLGGEAALGQILLGGAGLTLAWIIGTGLRRK